MLFILVKYLIYNCVMYIPVDGDLLNSVLLILEEATEAMVKLTCQHHVVFGTRWELNPGRGILIPHRVPLYHGPSKHVNSHIRILFKKKRQIKRKQTYC